MFVLMMIQGFPISAKLPEDLGFGERFWYWRGASGRTYIHSIYPAAACPPLPGAVYVAVRRTAGERRAIAAGRFPGTYDVRRPIPAVSPAHGLAADELHVHLLARGDAAAEEVLADLRAALAGKAAGHRLAVVDPATWGFGEARQGELFAA
jgi:hypothetical protein